MIYKKKKPTPAQCSSPLTLPTIATFDEDMHIKSKSPPTMSKPVAFGPVDTILFHREGSIGVGNGKQAHNNNNNSNSSSNVIRSNSAFDKYKFRTTTSHPDSPTRNRTPPASPTSAAAKTTLSAPKILKKQSSFLFKNNNNNTLNNTEKSIRWNPNVKGGGCAAASCNPASGSAAAVTMIGLGNSLRGIMTNLSEKLDGSALNKLGQGLEEGFGMMKCVGPTLSCAACDTNSFDNCKSCAKCGGGDRDGLFDLVYKEKRDDDNTHTTGEEEEAAASMRRTMRVYEEMKTTTARESRDCIEDSKCVLNDCREATVVMMNQQQSSSKNGSSYNVYEARKQQYRSSQSSSLRASAYNIETGMGNNNGSEDPFTSSMHASQKSPRATVVTTTNAGVQTDTSSNNKHRPASILKKGRHGSGGRGFSSSSTAILGVASAKNNNKKVLQEQKQQQYQGNVLTNRKKKKKNISRLVIGGLKKPMKIMSHGVKMNLKHYPKRILAITSSSTPTRNNVSSPTNYHWGYY